MKTLVSRRRTFLGLLSGAGFLWGFLNPLSCSAKTIDHAMSVSEIEALLKKYHNDPVKMEYINAGFLTTSSDVMRLHMFFSPSSIPSGMISEEVRTCVDLFDLRDRQCREIEKRHTRTCTVRFPQGPIELEVLPFCRLQLPDRLRKNPMTREDFAVGIEQFKKKVTN